MSPRTLISKYAGICTRCRRRFSPGTAIEWARGTGATHANPAECAAALAGPPPPPAPTAPQLRSVYDFLIAAQQRGLKHPKARFLAPGGGELRLSLAGERSKVPGSIQVYVRDGWVGRVEPPDGRIAGPLAQDQALVDVLLLIARDPAAAAKEYGALMCKCSFCGLPLTDDGSVEVGYGPVCAKKWGLPWQRKGTRVVQEVA